VAQKQGKRGRGTGRQFRNGTHKRYNDRHHYVSKSNVRRRDKRWIPRKPMLTLAGVAPRQGSIGLAA
jgi:hypothetical protein